MQKHPRRLQLSASLLPQIQHVQAHVRFHHLHHKQYQDNKDPNNMMNPAFDKDKRLQPLDQRNVEKSTTQMAQLHSDMDQNLAN